MNNGQLSSRYFQKCLAGQMGKAARLLGYETGGFINTATELITGKSLSDNLGDWVFESWGPLPSDNWLLK